MRGPFTPETIAVLARSAGFEFTPERCALLAPLLDWLLAEGERLVNLHLAGIEPALIFHPDTAVNPAGEGPQHG